MNADIKNINKRIVSEIIAILNFKAQMQKEVEKQDYQKARFYNNQKELRIKALVEGLAELQNFYVANLGVLAEEDFMLDLSGLKNKN